MKLEFSNKAKKRDFPLVGKSSDFPHNVMYRRDDTFFIRIDETNWLKFAPYQSDSINLLDGRDSNITFDEVCPIGTTITLTQDE